MYVCICTHSYEKDAPQTECTLKKPSYMLRGGKYE